MIQAVTCANTKASVMYRKCKVLVSVLLSQIFISKYWYWYQFLNKWYQCITNKGASWDNLNSISAMLS